MLKTYLAVPYADKDEVKRLGAWWDKKARFWYCDEADAARFSKWSIVPVEARPKSRKLVMSKPGVSTPRKDFSLPDCGCTHVAPWDDCEHTEPQLDGDEAQHMRAL